MSRANDDASPPRVATGLLTTLRDVLFEATPTGTSKVSPETTPRLASNADVETARAALRESLQAALGPAVREFALQIEALREVLPDAAQRRRAALRVLSLKGVSTTALVAEVERALAHLTEQNRAFIDKVTGRRASFEADQSRAEAACRAETADAEQTIARLEGELTAARAELTAPAARRENALAASRDGARRLSEKQLGFERAFSELRDEYVSLARQLSTPESA